MRLFLVIFAAGAVLMPWWDAPTPEEFRRIVSFGVAFFVFERVSRGWDS